MSCWEAHRGMVRFPGQVTDSGGAGGTVKVAEQEADWPHTSLAS